MRCKKKKEDRKNINIKIEKEIIKQKEKSKIFRIAGDGKSELDRKE